MDNTKDHNGQDPLPVSYNLPATDLRALLRYNTLYYTTLHYTTVLYNYNGGRIFLFILEAHKFQIFT